MKKAMKFVKGLNSLVKELILTQVLVGTIYEALLDMALLHEKGEREKKEEGKAMVV